MESFLYNKQKNLYTFYNDRVRWVIVFIELRYKKFPVPLLNEIRAAQAMLHVVMSMINQRIVNM